MSPVKWGSAVSAQLCLALTPECFFLPRVIARPYGMKLTHTSRACVPADKTGGGDQGGERKEGGPGVRERGEMGEGRQKLLEKVSLISPACLCVCVYECACV